uniref:Homeobox domain-containing protein n=1 Tax=Elaeophora elaphi TaxID=1147741 RepID=A0A0R3RL71_9BILA
MIYNDIASISISVYALTSVVTRFALTLGEIHCSVTSDVRVRTSEKYRMVYTDYQRLELEKEFRTSQFINSERKSQLSSELQLTERQIKIWFQNRFFINKQINKLIEQKPTKYFIDQDNEKLLHVSLR